MSTPSFDKLPLEAVSRAAHYNHRHRSVSSGGLRAAIFGASDGLVSNAALILGVAAATPGSEVVRLAGIAGLIAGAVSMAAGEYISMRAQSELYEFELETERQALAANPELETLELIKIYQERGVSLNLATRMAEAMMADPEVALEAHAREELGIDPQELGSPVMAASSSFVAFAVGAILPLIPWFFGGGSVAVVVSLVLATLGALVLGGVVGYMSGRSVPFAALRQLVIASLATTVTVAVGALVGAN
ncbi:MAG: VIT1/CCC1 transporter family protein [Acidimicrobiia bacterium]